MGPEIASAFVRIRPELGAFKTELVTNVKETLRKIQVEVGASARANVDATGTEIRANQTLAESYKIVMAASQSAVAAATDGIALNRQLAVGYTEAAAAAKAGSVEQLTYQKLANEALINSAATVQETARANVAATAQEIRANEELAASYGLIARNAKAGSAERIAATRLGGAAAGAGSGRGAAVAGAEGGVAGKAVGKGIGVAGLLGIAIGTAELFKLGKELTTQAGQVQKFRQVVAAEFGAAGKDIREWGENGAKQFGITDDSALNTASKFGILFKNLGIGQEKAATMTVGFEKLAGALSAIRGQDPDAVLGKLPLVAAGNTRALKQLGLAIDQNDIKNEALKEGLISTTKDAVTPAIKAQAVYALATKNLGSYLAQARAHQDDYANSSRRLKAELDNAGDAIGEALLPALSKVTVYLANNVPKAVEFVKKQFASIGPTLRADVKILEDIWERWGATIRRVVDVDLKVTIATIKNDLAFLQGVFNVAAGILTGDWQRFWDGIKAIPKTALEGVKLLVEANVHVLEAILDGIWNNIKESVIRLELWIVKQFSRIPTKIKTPFGTIGFTNPFSGLADGLQTELNQIKTDKIQASAARALKEAIASDKARAAAKAAGATLGGDVASGAAGAISQADIAALAKADAKIAAAKKSLAAALAAGDAQIKASQQALATYMKESAQQIAKIQEAGNAKVVKAARDAASNLVKIGKDLSAQIGKFLDTGPSKKAIQEGPLGQQFRVLKKLLDEGKGGPEVLRRAQLLASEMQGQQAKTGAVSKQKEAVTRHVNDLTDELNKHLITWQQFQGRLQRYLASQGITYKKIYGALGRSAADAFQAEVKGLGLQAKAIGTENPTVRGLVAKAGTSSTGAVKVIDPNAVLVKQQATLTAANTRRQLGITQREGALSRAEERASARAAAARDRLAHAQRDKANGIAAQSLANIKKIEQHTKAAAAAAKADKKQSGYPKSTGPAGPVGPIGVNPGIVGGNARYGATLVG